MAFVTGILLIDAQASALNNQGAIQGTRTDNTVGVKRMRIGRTDYPYVSAQAFKYWLRATLTAQVPEWQGAPIFREGKVAYTDANPIRWWDDDLLGYMRAPSKKSDAGSREWANETSLAAGVTLTRAAPFRVSTLMALPGASVAQDFGVMSRHEGDPVPFEHEFYRATLKGLFSLNLRECGRFSYLQRTGFLHLDENRKKEAEEIRLLHDEVEKTYSLPTKERVERVAALFRGLSLLEGGAKQGLHYTDVAPPFAAFAVTRGGNNIFNYLADPAPDGSPVISSARLKQILESWNDTVLSGPYVGWAPGYQEGQRQEFISTLDGMAVVDAPRKAFERFVADLQSKGESWFEA